MKNQDKLIGPDEQIIYSCKKEWLLFIIYFFFGLIFTLPITLIAISKRLPLEVRIIMLTFAIGFWIFIILSVRQYRRSHLILTNRRILLRFGMFKFKTYTIPLESIREIERVYHAECVFYIHTTDGRKIGVPSFFHWVNLEKWATQVNDWRGGTIYAEPENKRNPTALQQIAIFLVIMLLFLAIYSYFQFLKRKEMANDEKLKRPLENSRGKVIKHEWTIKIMQISKEYKNLVNLETTLGNQPEERIRLWKRFLWTYSDDIPGQTEDDKLKRDAWEKIITLQSQLPPGNPWRGVRLRSTYNADLSEEDCQAMVEKYDFFDIERNQYGNFRPQYQVITLEGDQVVLDYVTGLMWHPAGSVDVIPYKKIPLWLGLLNRRGYAGSRDWRLPTLEEAASLLTNSPQTGRCRIDKVFSKNKSPIFTGDQAMNKEPADSGPKNVWIVSYCWSSNCYTEKQNDAHYVRPVRSQSP